MLYVTVLHDTRVHLGLDLIYGKTPLITVPCHNRPISNTQTNFQSIHPLLCNHRGLQNYFFVIRLNEAL